MKKMLLALGLFWAALGHASSFIVVAGGVSVAGGSRVVLAISSAPAYSLLFASASNQRVDLGNNFRYQPTDAFTICASTFPTGNYSLFPTIFGNETAGAAGYNLFYTNSGAVDFQWIDGLGHEQEALSSTTYAIATQWHRVCVVVDGSNNAANYKLAVDGSFVSTSYPHTGALSAMTYGTSTRIGSDNEGELFNGYIADVAVYSAALNSSGIASDYNGGDLPSLTSAANIAHWYRMGNASNDTSSTIYDQVGTLNGTIVNGALVKNFAPFAFTSKFSQQVKNDANAPILSASGNRIFIPYYQSANADPGFDAPDLQVWDNSNHTSPSLNGTLASTYPSALTPYFGVSSGNYFFLVYSKNPSGGGPYLRVIDVSNPASPSSVATVAYDSNIGSAIGVALYGTTLYVSGSNVAGTAGVTAIIDASTPTAPATPSYFTTPNGPVCSPVISGTTLFVAGLTAGTVQIFDISTPTSPILKSTITCSSPPADVKISGNYLFITEQVGSTSSKVEVIDISNLSSPTSVKVLALPNPDAQQGVIVSSRNLLIVPSGSISGTGILYAISIYDPANSFIAGTYTMSSVGGFTKDPDYITSIGDFLYVTSNAATAPGNVIDFKGYLDIFGL
jgi:hypothetical protein